MSTSKQAPDVILHIPHSSTRLALADFTWDELFCRSRKEIKQDLFRSTDWFTNDLFDGIICKRVVFPYSRLLVDVERFVDNAREPMAAEGRGVIYKNDTNGERIRHRISPRLRKRLLGLYHEHHTLLGQAVDDALAAHGRCLIIDAHSFPDIPLEVDDDQLPDRRDICLGTDSFHTPTVLEIVTGNSFCDAGFTVAINSPYSGTIVPLDHLCETPQVSSIMIEVNRKLYMDETTGKPCCHYDAFHKKLRHCLNQLVDRWRFFDDFMKQMP